MPESALLMEFSSIDAAGRPSALIFGATAAGGSIAAWAVDSPMGGECKLTDMPSSFAIGDFSRATHLTVKMLRHYHGRAFGCVVTAYGWQACGTTLISLRMIAHALRAWPTPFGATLNASTPLFETDGTCIDDKIASQLAIVSHQVVEFARCRHAGLLPVSAQQ